MSYGSFEGGSGFLGQHVVSELLTEAQKMSAAVDVSQEVAAADTETETKIETEMKTEARVEDKTKASHRCCIKEIRVLDVKPYQPCTVSPAGEPAKVLYQKCDVRDLSQLTEALAGVAAVINCSAVTPDFTRDDMGCDHYMQEVNVDGVMNVVKACCQAGVSVLVHTSDVSVKMGGIKLLEHTETLTPSTPEKDLLLGDYARMRLRAEGMVLAAHGTPTSTGATLQTMVLRPPLIYGEGDTTFVPLLLSLARAGGSRIPSVGNPEAFLQAAYVGNVAVAHVCALLHLVSGDNEGMRRCGGLPVYVSDDTPPNNLQGLAEPFLLPLGLLPSKNLSYWIVSFMIMLASLWAFTCSLLGHQEKNKQSSLPSLFFHRFASTITVVNRMRAELCLGYTPPYSWGQSQERSNSYYANSSLFVEKH
nr:LOW QUALITY PROTEIN: 3 beta-hydroxysteroid dehydrogenase type 7-like [Cherax quadricarinatus]